MKNKRFIAIFLTLIAVAPYFFIPKVYASNSQDKPSTQDFDTDLVNYYVNKRDKAISLLLSSGWTMYSINDLLNENDLKVYEDAKSVSYNIVYSRECLDGNKLNREELSEQKFYYEVNKKNSEKNKFNTRNQIQLSSNGKLELTVLYNNSTKSLSDTYEDTDSTGYLLQTMNTVWMGNNTFSTSYRCEWIIEPQTHFYDSLGIAWDPGLVAANGNYEGYVYKCKNAFTGEEHEPFTKPVKFECGAFGAFAVLRLLNMENYQLYTNHRIYMRMLTRVLKEQRFYEFYGSYIHSRREATVAPNVNFTGQSGENFFSVSIETNPYHQTPSAHVRISK